MIKSRCIYIYIYTHTHFWGHAVAFWLMHYATSQKVVGARPNEVNYFYSFT
jgi:hypothetical protein